MPSLVIINLTNLVLNLAVCQVGPLYYENRVLPGGIMHRSLAHVFYTIEVKPWDRANEYDDTQVAAKLAQAIFTLGGLLTPWEFPSYFRTVDHSRVPFWYLKHRDLPWYKEPGIHMSRHRTFILEGGPEQGDVILRLHANHSIAQFGLTNEKEPLGSLRIREIPFEMSHKHFYIDDRIRVKSVHKGNPQTTTVEPLDNPNFIET